MRTQAGGNAGGGVPGRVLGWGGGMCEAEGAGQAPGSADGTWLSMAHSGKELGRRPGKTHLDTRQSPELELSSADCWQALGAWGRGHVAQ